MMTPYIVDSISDSEGRTVVKNKPAEAGTVMSAEEAEYLTECMREVITSGTGNSMKYHHMKQQERPVRHSMMTRTDIIAGLRACTL